MCVSTDNGPRVNGDERARSSGDEVNTSEKSNNEEEKKNGHEHATVASVESAEKKRTKEEDRRERDKEGQPNAIEGDFFLLVMESCGKIEAARVRDFL